MVRYCFWESTQKWIPGIANSKVVLHPVETSWNKGQIEFWLREVVSDYFNHTLKSDEWIIEQLLPTLDDLGQRFKEFEEDQRADNYNNY